MSNKLSKPGLIDIPGDVEIGSVTFMRSGRVAINFPTIHPRDVCKLLSGVQFDLMFGVFKIEEKTNITIPQIDGVPNGKTD